MGLTVAGTIGELMLDFALVSLCVNLESSSVIMVSTQGAFAYSSLTSLRDVFPCLNSENSRKIGM